jgi:2-polyprenyl-3-methyl-5-hydroxy-6-metoxy-1,4-benzoquinol methylase
MINNIVESFEKIRRQFDTGPYPRTPLEQSPKKDVKSLYIHNIATSYYIRNQKVIETQGKLILDAGCGTGYKSLILAEANPGAKIIGVDISEKSLELARQRLQYHGFNNTEFYLLAIEDLPQLGLEFDYINCDDVLYLLAEPAIGLQAMKSVLKPDGIIRANLHSLMQRTEFYRAQEVFKYMGLMDDNPAELEMDLVRDTMKALKDGVRLKATTWKPDYDNDDPVILMNYLFQGDKGYTISDIFSALRAAKLEFINMVNWRQWNLMDLFKEPDNLPAFLAMSLPETTVEEQLHLYELLNPVHRLLDFWCGHPERGQSFIPVTDWEQSDWEAARVHLLPQLKTPEAKADLINCLRAQKRFELSQHLDLWADNRISIEPTSAACLFPLWEQAQPVSALVNRWQQLRPVDLVTLEPATAESAWNVVIQSLIALESYGYLFLERH